MELISTILGIPINIASNLSIFNKYQYPFNIKEDAFIESEIQSLLKKEVIRTSSHEPGESIQPVITTRIYGLHKMTIALKYIYIYIYIYIHLT